jgi:hypothetical protein
VQKTTVLAVPFTLFKMKTIKDIFFIIVLMSITLLLNGQVSIQKQGAKYGMLKNMEIFLPPVYDTILPFDSTNSVCMACVKSQKAGNKFIKTNNTILVCKYMNSKKEELVIEYQKDTTSYFTFSKHSYQDINHTKPHLIVSARGKKFLVSKTFEQLTFRGYDDIIPTVFHNFFIIHNKTVGASYLEGLINVKEELIMPLEYSSIKTNPFDSLLMGCTALIKTNGNDDVYTLEGKKIHSFNRHIECASNNFIIHKVFLPQEHYVILNLETNKEKNIFAEEIVYLGKETISVKLKGKYHICNLYELENYKFLNYEKH